MDCRPGRVATPAARRVAHWFRSWRRRQFSALIALRICHLRNWILRRHLAVCIHTQLGVGDPGTSAEEGRRGLLQLREPRRSLNGVDNVGCCTEIESRRNSPFD
jgi:hypothetical protein